ncbi:MAG: hypothetical protein ACTSU5_00415 [Promethearchaeota archaeon]
MADKTRVISLLYKHFSRLKQREPFKKLEQLLGDWDPRKSNWEIYCHELDDLVSPKGLKWKKHQVRKPLRIDTEIRSQLLFNLALLVILQAPMAKRRRRDFKAFLQIFGELEQIPHLERVHLDNGRVLQGFNTPPDEDVNYDERLTNARGKVQWTREHLTSTLAFFRDNAAHAWNKIAIIGSLFLGGLALIISLVSLILP